VSSVSCSARRRFVRSTTSLAPRITPQHYAYLKISEGCDRTCTFCSIPSMRGKHVHEAGGDGVYQRRSELVEDGVRELILVATGHDLLRDGPVRRGTAGEVAS
jgi:tRNA A37 methylthiotransferase MiaB